MSDGVVGEARRQFEAQVAALREREGFPARERGPDELERNVGILYERICRGQGPLEIWNIHEERAASGNAHADEALTYEAIRAVISSTARLLGIALL